MTDRPKPLETSEGSVAIDLSRRKDRSRDIVRASVVAAARGAAPDVIPYVTSARIVLAELARSRLARIGALVLTSLALVAIFADFLASSLPVACAWRGRLYVLPNVTQPAALSTIDCARMDRERGPGDWRVEPLVAFGPDEAVASALQPPFTRGHPFGTDARGRDVFARVVHGARTSLVLGAAASLALVALGVGLGAIAGFAGGAVDALVSRAVESLTAIPTFVLVLVVCGLVPQPTTATLLWTIALTRWPQLARLVRAEVLRAGASDYVTAARAIGATPARVLCRHVLPNAVGPAIVAAAFGIASVVLLEAAVDFLRVGVPDTAASWGETLGEARAIPAAWWLLAFPGMALLATLVSLNLVGEALRDALDPQLRGVGEALTERMRS